MTTIRIHSFRASRYRDYRMRPICEECGNVAESRVHDVPKTPDEAAEIDARKLGETDGG